MSAYFQKMAVFLYYDRLAAPLKQMSVPAMLIIEELRVESVKLPHADGKNAFRGLDEEVVMVGHEAIGVTDPMVAFVDVLKGIEKCFLVMVILENRFILIRFETIAAGVMVASEVFPFARSEQYELYSYRADTRCEKAGK